MPDIIDGNNLLGRLGGGTKEGLLAELTEWARRRRTRLTVVFDGPPGGGRPKVQSLGDVTVVHAAPLTADDEIVRRIREARDPKGFTVVTDDRVLCSLVRATGARTVGVGEFSQKAEKSLAPRPEAAAPAKASPGPVNMKDWERWFQDPGNRLK
ncbi:MAG: NYN domain-containing protein [Acidobacteria bacterium]|nr:NYN domain-containing protein [Acidobacteriota bacterium]